MQYFAKKYACHADDFLAEKNKAILTQEPSDPLVSMMCFGYAAVAMSVADDDTDRVQVRVFSRPDLHGKHRWRMGEKNHQWAATRLKGISP